MRRELITSALAVIVLTVVLGLAYPLVVTGVAQVVFPDKRERSQDHATTARSSARSCSPRTSRKPVLDKNGKPKRTRTGTR